MNVLITIASWLGAFFVLYGVCGVLGIDGNARPILIGLLLGSFRRRLSRWRL